MNRKSILLLAASVTVLVISAVLFFYFRIHERSSLLAIAQKEQKLRQEMHVVWNKYRRITNDLGYNLLILPEGQNPADLYNGKMTCRYMPQFFADTLEHSKKVLVQQILPSLLHNDWWPEQKRNLFVYGVRLEEARSAQKNSDSIQQQVTDNSIVLGNDIWRRTKIKTGDTVIFHGQRLHVGQCYEQRNNRDDNSAWIELSRAQKLFNKPGLINSILALDCRCEVDSALANLKKNRKELACLLPQTQIIEFSTEEIKQTETRYTVMTSEWNELQKEKTATLSKCSKYMTIAKWVSALMIIIIILLIVTATFRKKNVP
jgi:hypothetical protein